MADYYPLIARAIAGLDPNASGESRRALYERARSALIAQLRSVEPALSEAEITRERLALEESVRRVEAEAVQRQRSVQRPDSPPRGDARPDAPRQRPPEGPPREGPRPGDALRDSARAAAARMAASGASANRPPSAPGERSSRNLRPDAPHGSNDQPPHPRSDQRQDSRQDSWDDIARARDTRTTAGSVRRAFDSERPSLGGPTPPGQGTRGFRDVVADANDLGNAAAQANRAARKTYSKVPSPSPEFDRLEPGMEQRGAEPHDYSPPLDTDDVPVRTRRFPLKAAIIVGILLMLIGGGFWAAPKIMAMLKSKPPVQVTQPAANGDAGVRPKITDRVGQPGSSQQIAPVAQRAILYEEDPSDPQGKQSVGTVVWRTDQIAASPKQKPDTAIRADIEIPDRKMKVTVTILRNTDPAMPATSHTIEVVYTVPPDFGTTIANVPGIYAKSPDQPRGTPLAATSVKVQDGYFLIGLSNVETDRARNIQVLKERSSLDIPMVYGDQKRAILSIEKGPPGERVFNEAFAAWGQ
jgi:hypothetical protein